MNVNSVSTMFSIASWVIYVLIGCIHSFMRYWQLLEAKITTTCFLPHSENKRQHSVNSFRWCIFGNQGIARIFTHITELLTAFKCRNTMYQRYNTDSKLIDIANCETCRHVLLVVENGILIRYYQQSAKTRALNESIDEPSNKPSNSDGLGV